MILAPCVVSPLVRVSPCRAQPGAEAQIYSKNPNVKCVNFRGNVQTRHGGLVLELLLLRMKTQKLRIW